MFKSGRVESQGAGTNHGTAESWEQLVSPWRSVQHPLPKLMIRGEDSITLRIGYTCSTLIEQQTAN